MISNPLVRKAVQVEYAILRTPLAVVNRQLAGHLADSSRVRLSVEQGLHSLDTVAGRLLTTSKPEVDPATTDSADAPSRPVEVPVDEVERVADELLAEQADKPMVGELADPDLQEVQARLRAKHLVEEHEEAQRQLHSDAAAAE